MKNFTPRNELVRALLVAGLVLTMLLGCSTESPEEEPLPTPTATQIPEQSESQPDSSPGEPTATDSAEPALYYDPLLNPKTGGTLTLALRSYPPAQFDRTKTNVYFEITPIGVGVWGYGNIVRPCREDQYQACPGLAESWVTTDFTEWTFQIRNGVSWHDGVPFTAEDVEFWLDLVTGKVSGGGNTRGAARYLANFKQIETYEVLDGNRVRLTLARRNPDFLLEIYNVDYQITHAKHLAMPFIERGEVDVSPQELGFIGTGPYKLVEAVEGSHVTLEKSDQYWDVDDWGNQLPYLDTVRFAVMADPSAMDAAFRAGHLDGGSYGGGFTLSRERQAAYVDSLGDQVVFHNPATTTWGIGFNTLIPGPLQDVRVRQAISLWMDREAAVFSLWGGTGANRGITRKQSPYGDPDFMTWPGWNLATREADKARAKELMAAAGYPDGFEVGMLCFTNTVYVEACEFYQDQLRGLGITLNLELRDNAGYSAGRSSLDYDILPLGPNAQRIIAASESSLGVYSEWPGAAGKHEDAKITAYFDSLRAAEDIEEKIRIWRELEQYYIFEQAYAAPLFAGGAMTPYRSYVRGIINDLENTPNQLDLAVVWLDK